MKPTNSECETYGLQSEAAALQKACELTRGPQALSFHPRAPYCLLSGLLIHHETSHSPGRLSLLSSTVHLLLLSSSAFHWKPLESLRASNVCTTSFILTCIFNTHHCLDTVLSPGKSQWATEAPCLRLGSPRSTPGDMDSCASSIFRRWSQETPAGGWGSGAVKGGAAKGYIFQQVQHCRQVELDRAGEPRETVQVTFLRVILPKWARGWAVYTPINSQQGNSWAPLQKLVPAARESSQANNCLW